MSLERDGEAPYRDPWAGGVFTLTHHPRVLKRQRVTRRYASGELPPVPTAVLLVAAAAVYVSLFVLGAA